MVPGIISYFMAMFEAAELVIQAGAMGEGGDVFRVLLKKTAPDFEPRRRNGDILKSLMGR